MSSQFLEKVADLLEKVAVHLDELEVERTQALRDERLKVAHALREKIANATGEELPEDILEKLASDQTMVDTLIKLAERTGDAPPEALGEPSNIQDNRARVVNTKVAQLKEAADQADDSFLNWIMS